MSWFPDYHSDLDDDLSNAALLAAGKALYLCNSFEGTCAHIKMVIDLVNYLEKNPDQSLKDAYRSFKEKQLSGTIADIGKSKLKKKIF